MKYNKIIYVGLIYCGWMHAWNMPPADQEKLRTTAQNLVYTYGGSKIVPTDAALVTAALYERYIMGSGAIPGSSSHETIVKGVAVRIAHEEFKKIDTSKLTAEEKEAVLNAQESSINNCQSAQTLSYYFDRMESRKRLKQGIDNKIKNRAVSALPIVGDCSNCFEERYISPYSCGNPHKEDMWACDECKKKVKSSDNKCPWCRAPLK